ncbi:GGDEF domain-containing protein [Catenovulum sp. 2E275]|uniref:sensor domain-containing diguanylate cyclase n=1 Tax=Catenovulum sp. 2E275 TaxID=2980497 RepID=UPI0021D27207|nr:GGDEF domain-containing protein [Catenovulum sp. 2E275]MCU4675855.1 GGDEF domain-containing protein [Catenovulum sp. 2E275]
MEQILLRNILDSIDDIIFVKDINFIYIGCNNAFCHFVGAEREYIIGKTDFEIFSDQQQANWFRKWDEKVFIEEQTFQIEENCKHPSKGDLWFDTIKYPFKNEQNETIAIIGICRDITSKKDTLAEIHKLNQELLYQSSHDKVTKLNNRHYFESAFSRILPQPTLLPIAVLLIDIDYFKQYNDCYGHLAGDKCLQLIAEQLKLVISSQTDLVARFGGDEFILVLTNINERKLNKKLESLLSQINKLNLSHKGSKISNKVTLTIGGYLYSNSSKPNASELINQADKALYQAKSTGRNQYSLIKSL